MCQCAKKTATTSYQRNLKWILRLVIQTEVKCSSLYFCKIESIMPADLFGSLQKISHLMLLKIANIMFWSGSSSYLFFFAILFLSETHSSYFHWKEDEEGQTSSLFQLSSLCFLGMQKKSSALLQASLEFFQKVVLEFFLHKIDFAVLEVFSAKCSN